MCENKSKNGIDCSKRKAKRNTRVSDRAGKVVDLNGETFSIMWLIHDSKCKSIIVNCNSSSSLLCWTKSPIWYMHSKSTKITSCHENASNININTNPKRIKSVYSNSIYYIVCYDVIWVQNIIYRTTWINDFSIANKLHTIPCAYLFLSFFHLNSSLSSSFSHHLFHIWNFLWAAEDCSLISIQIVYSRFFFHICCYRIVCDVCVWLRVAVDLFARNVTNRHRMSIS